MSKEKFHKTTWIYALCSPITNLPRYIGKTNNLAKRYDVHIHDKIKSYKCSWIKSLKEQGLLPVLMIIEECKFNIWKEREIYWINYCTECGIKLTNLTKGGDGGQCEESRKKLSEAAKKEWADPEYRAKHKIITANRYTKEVRKKNK